MKRAGLLIIVLLLVVSTSHAAILSSDNFNRASANPIGSPWVDNVGSAKITDNSLVSAIQSGGDAEFHYEVAPGTANYFVGVKMYDKNSSNYSGPAGRMTTYTLAANRTLYRISANASTWNLDEILNNVSVTIVTATQGWVAGDRFVLKVYDGDKSMYLNGVQVGGTSASNGVTGAGFGGIRDGSTAPGGTYDNFAVTTTLSEADCFARTGTTVGCSTTTPSGGLSGLSLLDVGGGR